MYYRQQGQGFYIPIPGFQGQGGGNIDQRLDRLERQVERLDRRYDRLNRRLQRVERQLGYQQNYGDDY